MLIEPHREMGEGIQQGSTMISKWQAKRTRKPEGVGSQGIHFIDTNTRKLGMSP